MREHLKFRKQISILAFQSKPMLKAFFSLALLLSSIAGFSTGKTSGYDYYIIFVGEFKNDKISLAINHKTVLNNCSLENIDPLKKGNLSISQKNEYITIAYNGKTIKKSKISVDFTMDLDITVNNKKKAFQVNLRKGKVVLVDYSSRSDNPAKELSVEQVQEPVLLI